MIQRNFSRKLAQGSERGHNQDNVCKRNGNNSRNDGELSTMKRSLKLSFATVLFLFLAMPLLHAQNETAAQRAARYSKSCDAGKADDCIALGTMLVRGDGVTKDAAQADVLIKKAAGLYQKACDGGDARACTDLGDMWRTFASADATAVPLYRKACDGGDATGCKRLGDMYKHGWGITEDYTQAVPLYRKACDGGNMSACDSLAGMYSYGWGVAQDHTQEIVLRRKACNGGDAGGCTSLGIMYQYGNWGLPTDKAQAIELYRKACAIDHSNSACDFLKRLENK